MSAFYFVDLDKQPVTEVIAFFGRSRTYREKATFVKWYKQ